MRPCGLEVADIFRQIGPAYRAEHATSLSRGQTRVMSAIEQCRTAALGGHVEQCDACGHHRISYNSCLNRHCQKCQSFARDQWLEDRQAELLPVEYFHVVFTVPQEIAAIALQNKAVVYNILFLATSQTLSTIAAERLNPRVHLCPWKRGKPRLFRRLFLELLRQAFDGSELQFFNALEGLRNRVAFEKYLAPAANTEWVVYAKPPFGGPKQVLEYLGRYTHRVAISNNRLLNFSDGDVSFAWKDYRHESRSKTMQLDGQEFIRRFLLHALPSGFQRIRHYGLLANANRYREANLERCRELLALPAPVITPSDAPLDYRDRYERLTGVSLRECPHCHHGQMFQIEAFAPGKQPRGPPPLDTS